MWWWLLVLAGCERIVGFQTVLPPAADSPRALVFDNSSSSVDLMGFVVLVELDESNIHYGAIVDPVRELRFHDELTKADLPFEVEHYDPLGKLDVWVRVPVIHAHSATDRILMFYGPDAAGTDNVAATWADYDLVFHADSLVDASGHAMPQVTSQSTPKIGGGAIGDGYVFDGASQRIEMTGAEALLSNWPTYTIELWLQPQFMPDPFNLGTVSGTMQPIEPAVIGKPGGAIQGGRIRNSVIGAPSPFVLQTDFFWEGQNPLQGAIFYLPDLEWSYVTFSYDQQYLWWYRNGVILDVYGNDVVAPSANDTSAPLELAGGDPLNATIDEVRVSRSYRDENWVFAQYLSMTRHFVSITNP